VTLMLNKRIYTLFAFCLTLVFALSLTPLIGASNDIRDGEMAGYLGVPHERVPETYGGGFSLYVAAWPLLEKYPGNRFQTGLFGTWMHAQNDFTEDNPKPIERMYSDIEGGAGLVARYAVRHGNAEVHHGRRAVEFPWMGQRPRGWQRKGLD
jgi:hypothetical protein